MGAFLRRLTDGWKLKLLAFLLAVLLWIVVSAEEVRSEWIRVDVQTQLLDDDYTVTRGPVPDSVQVYFTGPKRELFELAVNRPRLILPIRDADGRQFFQLDPRMVVTPSTPGVNARAVEPNRVWLDFDRIVTREVPVELRVGQGPARGLTVVDAPEVEPAVVRVTGPQDRVSAIDRVVTRPLDLSDVDSTFSLLVELDADTLRGVRLSRRTVTATGQVGRIVERTFEVPVSVEGLDARPRVVRVRVAGPRAAVLEIDPGELRVVIPPSLRNADLPPEGVVVAPVVENLPSGVRVETVPREILVLPQERPAEPIGFPLREEG